MPSTRRSTIRAAGCVVWRHGADGLEVVLVHRPRYDDWSFPKGKLDRGERLIVAAVREVEEETGLRVRVGPRLHDEHYTLENGTPKVVSYWAARPPAKGDVSSYQANAEIDRVQWMQLDKARRRLTQPHDVDLLKELSVSAYDASVLLLVRHAEARKRKTWRGEDHKRPLSAEGKRSAQSLVPVLGAYGITTVLTSDAVRCVDTVRPYVEAYGVPSSAERAVAEEDATAKSLSKLAKRVLATSERTAICTHRPVLHGLCAALGIEHLPLEPGGMLVVHRKHGSVLSVEKPE